MPLKDVAEPLAGEELNPAAKGVLNIEQQPGRWNVIHPYHLHRIQDSHYQQYIPNPASLCASSGRSPCPDILPHNCTRGTSIPAGTGGERMTEPNQTTLLTKSDFLRYRTCPAYCWTHKYRPDLIPEAPIDALRRANDGGAIELLARDLFPDGVLVDARDATEATRATEIAIANGATTIFQAAVITRSGLHARADVLTRHPSGHGWNLIEIKSSTSAAFDHKKDATFQRIAFTEAGFTLRDVQLMHLDRAYRRNGRVELERLFRFDSSVMAWSQRYLGETMAEIDAALTMVRHAEICPPCGCDQLTRGKRCPVFPVFHPELLGGNTVYDLVSINQKHLSEARDRGVMRLADWPADIRLNTRQRWQIEAVRSGQERVMRDPLRQFLATMQRPCYFLDYETVQTPVPLFRDTWPYQQVPFQYSVHVLDESGLLHHREFLWVERGENPIPPLADALRRDIGDEGSVLVWHKGFEGKRNEEMAASLPHIADFLLGLNHRMVDLMESVSQGMWIHPDFGGSTSIKKVLPVVAPDLAYDSLPIGGGALATLRWKQCVVDAMPPEGIDPEQTFANLRDYCRHDTLAMVRIWEYLNRLAGTAPATTADRVANLP